MIKWNKYPDVKPEEGKIVDIILSNRRRIIDCEVDEYCFYEPEYDEVYMFEDGIVTHWAEINLPE